MCVMWGQGRARMEVVVCGLWKSACPWQPSRHQGVRYRPDVDPDMTKAHTDCAQG